MLFRSGTSERDKREILPPRIYAPPSCVAHSFATPWGAIYCPWVSVCCPCLGSCCVPALAFAASGAHSAEYFSICSRTPPRLSRGSAFSAAKGTRPRYAEHLRRFRSFAMICYCGGVPGGWGVPPGF